MTKKRVLITGASGFLGNQLIEAALDHQLDPVAAIRASSKTDHLKQFPVTFVTVNLEQTDELAALLKSEQIDYLIHAAGATKAKNQDAYDYNNEVIARKVGLAAEKAGIKKMVLVSSLAAAGPIHMHQGLIDETVQPKPVTAYGRSKLKGEQALSSLDIPLAIIRPTAIYGPREKDIFLIVKMIQRGWDLYIGKFNQQLSFVHGRDVAEAILLAALQEDATGIYHISDGTAYNRYALADLLQDLLGKKASRWHLPLPLVRSLAWGSDQINALLKTSSIFNSEKLAELTAENWACDISKARTELNFNPRYSLKEGWENTLRWYQDQHWI